MTFTHIFYLLFLLKSVMFKNEEHPFKKADSYENSKNDNRVLRDKNLFI